MKEIIYILLNISILTLWIQGLTIMQGDGMILHGLKTWSDKFFDKNNPTWTKYYLYQICNPLFLCSKCMNSVHGLIVYSAITYLNSNRFNIIEYCLIAVSGVAAVSFTDKFVE